MTSSKLLSFARGSWSKKSKSKDIPIINITLIIKIQDLNMLRTITALSHNIFLHYSSDQYYLNIIYSKQPKFRIASEEKIVYFTVLNSLQRSYMQKNTTVDYYYVIVVDVTLGWAIYCIKSLQSQEPVLIYKGKFISEKHDLKKLVGIHEMDQKIVLVFDKFILYYMHLPTELKKVSQPLINKEFIPYGSEPQYLYEPFSLNKGFLPQQQQLDISFTYYQNISEDKGVILIAVQSKANKLNSIYSVEYDRKKCYLLSGRSIFLNIENKILNILPTKKSNLFLIQTEGKLITWYIDFLKAQSNFQHYDYKLSPLNKYQSKNGTAYIALEQNKPVVIALSNKENQVIKSSTPLRIPNELNCQQIYAHQKYEDFYLLSKKGQFYYIKKDGANKVIQNSFTSIAKSNLNISDTHNFLIVEKKIGNESNKILLGNHLFAYQSEHFSHGMLLSASNLLFTRNDTETCFAYLTSPLIGLLKLDINRKKSKNAKQNSKKVLKDQSQLFQLSIDKSSKLSNQQTYFLSQNYQITQEEVIEIGKKSTKVAKMFENAIGFIEKALVLSNQLVILTISQQIHIFDTKLMRKYIYCFNSQIKNIYPLNNINVIGVQLYEPIQKTNLLHVLVLQQQKATKMKTISIPDTFSYVQLSTTINTSEYKLNLFGNQLIICTNDSLHKYQIDKIVVQNYDLPLPQSNYKNFQIVHLLNFSKDKNTSEFLLIFREQQQEIQDSFSRVEVYFCSFLQKYLFKKLQLKNLYFNYQKIMTLTQLPKDTPLLAATYNFSQGSNKNALSYRYLLLLGQKYVSVCSMKFGKIQLQYLANSSYLRKQLQKIETIPEKIEKAAGLLTIQKPITLLKTKKSDYFLIFNHRQIYYAAYQTNKINTISYYSLINDEFVTFRNNLHINQLNDQEFMGIFSQKMMIKDIKYLSDSIIFVLYEYCIVVLEIGPNNSLVVKQEIKFRNTENTQVIKIEQFLQNYDQQSIYLRESHGRIYLLKKVDKNYEIVFHSYMDEEVILFTRINNWFNRYRTLRLENLGQQKHYQELVLKKDGQLLIKSQQAKQEENKLVYV